MFLPVMRGMWMARASPPRSTSATIGRFSAPPDLPPLVGLRIRPRGKRLGNFLLTVIGLVRLHDVAFPADRTGVRIAHRFADTMRHEPCRLVSHAKGSAKLVRSHALLRCCQQVGRQNPLTERDMAALENRAGRDRELPTAASAM